MAVYAVFHAFNTTFPGFIYGAMAPSFQAADSLLFTVITDPAGTLLLVFGIHDAALCWCIGTDS